jgi:hypothetical protein
MLYKIGFIGGLGIIFVLCMGIYFIFLSLVALSPDAFVFGMFCLCIGIGAFALHSRNKTTFPEKLREIFR